MKKDIVIELRAKKRLNKQQSKQRKKSKNHKNHDLPNIGNNMVRDILYNACNVFVYVGSSWNIQIQQET